MRDIEILQRRIQGATYEAIAKEFELSKQRVSGIVAKQIAALAALEASSQLKNMRLVSQLIEEQRHADGLSMQLQEAGRLESELRKQMKKQDRLLEQAKQRHDALTKKCAELELSAQEWKARAMQRSEPKTYRSPMAMKHLK